MVLSAQRRVPLPRHPILSPPAALLALAVCLAAPAAAQQAGKAGDTPPPAVVVAAVETKAVDNSSRFIGNIKAIQSVALTARVEGFLQDVAFEEGSMVAQGQVLYRIEQDQYQADLDQAEGQLAAAKADSDAAAAALEDKEADFQRQATLIKKGDTSQTAFDQAKAARDEAKANVEKAKASEQQAQATVDNAKINLGYTTIASPIAGRIGATAVTAGNLVSATSGTLATVAQLDPIRAVFSVPSADLVQLQKRLGSGTRAETRATYVPKLVLPDGTDYDHPGSIAFADNQVSATTGTVAIYADFPNPNQVLLPGQFVSVVVHQAKQEELPVVPAAAIQRSRDGVEVYVVDGDDRVQVRTVELGTTVGAGYAVKSGLAAGELVIVSGLQKVEPGMTVKPTGASGSPGSGAESAPAAKPSAAPAADGAAPAEDSGSATGTDASGG
jgi:membrane fusion protein, multidrug efflux system